MKKILLFIALTLFLHSDNLKDKIDHIVVIYLENRSFDSLFRGFEGANTSDNPLKPYPLQSDLNGTVYSNIPLTDEARKVGLPIDIKNAPFSLDAYLPQTLAIPDLIHRFDQANNQIKDGKNDRFAAISDEKGLVMGYRDISKSALWSYAKEYTLCDNFFTAAFGGSFLNHQWLIAAKTPYVGEDSTLPKYKLGVNGEVLEDGVITPDGYVVNTIQPHYPPYDKGENRLIPLDYDTVGDRLSQKNISWGWYSGDYDKAMRGKGQKVDYQYHHDPFVYFKNYAPNTKGREHIKDEKDFFQALKKGKLPSVSFFKPSAIDNQHPGYATIVDADEKVKEIMQAIWAKPKIWNKSVIIITYDENGGLWDHVAPPVVDRWGPGSRIPAIIISPFAKKGFIDHTLYDTTSILRFIEWRYDLEPLGERKSNNMLGAFE